MPHCVSAALIHDATPAFHQIFSAILNPSLTITFHHVLIPFATSVFHHVWNAFVNLVPFAIMTAMEKTSCYSFRAHWEHQAVIAGYPIFRLIIQIFRSLDAPRMTLQSPHSNNRAVHRRKQVSMAQAHTLHHWEHQMLHPHALCLAR